MSAVTNTLITTFCKSSVGLLGDELELASARDASTNR
jgi:hypothetical protein